MEGNTIYPYAHRKDWLVADGDVYITIIAVGEEVEWTSHTNGGVRHHKGKVISLVPAGADPMRGSSHDLRHTPKWRLSFKRHPITQDRAVVEVLGGQRGSKFYAPYLSVLHRQLWERVKPDGIGEQIELGGGDSEGSETGDN